jgi:hypothetical protein
MAATLTARRGLLVLVAGALAVAAVLPAAARAHVPVLEPSRASDAPATAGDPFPGAVALPDPAVSRAVYGTLAQGEESDVYSLRTGSAVEIPVELLVPVRDEYADFRPSFALVGPGLGDEAPPFIAARLREAGLTDLGTTVVTDPGLADRGTFYEPFSFTSYYRGGEVRVRLRPGETYYLVVYDEDRTTGEYAVGLGEAEQFGGGDVLRTLVIVPRMKLGLYGQGAFHPLAAVLLGLVLTALVLGAALLVRRRLRRPRTA